MIYKSAVLSFISKVVSQKATRERTLSVHCCYLVAVSGTIIDIKDRTQSLLASSVSLILAQFLPTLQRHNRKVISVTRQIKLTRSSKLTDRITMKLVKYKLPLYS